MSYPTVVVEIDFVGGAFATPTWTDVTTDVVGGLEAWMGRQGDEHQPGFGRVTLDNRAAAYDPLNTSGPHYGNLLPGRRIRVRADGHPVAYGLIRGWPVRPSWRRLSYVDVEWLDTLSRLARIEMDDSLWADVIRAASGKLAWYRWDDRPGNPLQLDHSGLDNHGTWRTSYALQIFAPDPIPAMDVPSQTLVAGIIPQAKGGAFDSGRLVALIGSEDVGGNLQKFAAWLNPPRAAGVDVGEFSLELWYTHREPYVSHIDAGTGLPVHKYQILWTQGRETLLVSQGSECVQLRIGHPGSDYTSSGAAAGQPFLYVNHPTLPMTASSYVCAQAMTPGTTYHIVVTVNGTALNFYIDGTLVSGYTMSATLPSFGGYALADISPAIGGWYPNGVYGDVVIWDRALSAAEAQEHYRAGVFGQHDATADTGLTSGLVDYITNRFSLTGNGVDIRTGRHLIRTRIWDSAKLIDYLRAAADAEQGPLFQAADGALTFWPDGWRYANPRSARAQLDLTDTTGGDLGYEEDDRLIEHGEDQLVTEAVARWADGEERVVNTASETLYGRFTRSVDTMLPTAVEARSLGDWHVNYYAAPRPLWRRVTIQPMSGTRLWSAAVLPGVSGNHVSTPDHAALAPGTQLCARAVVALADWTPSGGQALHGQWGQGTNQLSWAVLAGSAGPELYLSADGTTATIAEWAWPTDLQFRAGDTVGVQALWDGTAGTVSMSWKPSSPLRAWSDLTGNTGWHELARTSLTGTIPATLHNSTAEYRIGSLTGSPTQPAEGSFYAVGAWAGTSSSGTAMVTDDFTVVTPAASSWTSTSGRAMTLATSGGTPAVVTGYDEWDAALGLRWGDRVSLTHTDPTGTTYTAEYWVDAVRHNADPGQGAWRVTLDLDPVPADPGVFLAGISQADLEIVST